MRSKLEKLIGKLEKEFEVAGPVRRKRIMKKASSIQRKINRLDGN